MKHSTKLAALTLLMAGLFTACTPNFEIAGSAWSNYVTGTDDDGDHYKATYALVCNTGNSGMLFVDENYGDPMSLCFAMPVSYTWDDNTGTATATFSHPEYGTQTFTIPMNWTKTTGLNADFLAVEQALEIPRPIELEQKSFAKPSSMTGTRWTLEFDERDGMESMHYCYNLEFVSPTGAVLNLIITENDEEEPERYRWNVNYTYSDGVGKTNIYTDEITTDGGFYMPDGNHMFFCDGENGLILQKQ